MYGNLTGEVISIGDEITCGKLLDSNSQWISQRLGELGVSVRFHSTIGDSFDAYQIVLDAACQRSDIIVCSGGLGPTEDDLTAEALAKLSGVEMEFDEQSWSHIQSIFARRNRPIAPKNRKQALRPRGSRAIFNPNGTAPGIDLTMQCPNGNKSRIFAFPGVPAELHEMWPTAAAEIRRMTGGRVFCHFTLNCFGAGESDIEAMIPPEIMRRGRDPLVGITASQATISLRASTSADSDELCHNALRPTIEQLRAVLGDLVYGEQDEPLESVVLRQMHKAKRTIAVADFGLEGTFFQSLRRHDSAGESMRGGLQLDGTSSACVFPDTSQYQGDQDRWLAEVAAQVRRMFETELGLAIGPLPAVNHRDQTFPIALVASQRRWAKELSCAGHPAIRLVRANKQVLNFLRLEVLRA